jgi:hypothetical protein
LRPGIPARQRADVADLLRALPRFACAFFRQRVRGEELFDAARLSLPMFE